MSARDGGPAFPSAMHIEGCSDDSCARSCPIANGGGTDGLSLRDWFAGQALAGMLAYSYVNPAHGNYHENSKPAFAASDAYSFADAMLAARERKP